jgi:hypothetical protein
MFTSRVNADKRISLNGVILTFVIHPLSSDGGRDLAR